MNLTFLKKILIVGWFFPIWSQGGLVNSIPATWVRLPPRKANFKLTLKELHDFSLYPQKTLFSVSKVTGKLCFSANGCLPSITQ